jgi:dihydroorotate dehydrogenase (NAD+) catalytic subunit
MNQQQTMLSVEIAGVTFKNPVLAASGTFGYGIEFSSIVDLNRLGGIVVKGLSVEPMDGNPPLRMYETAAGMLNSIGLQNVGVNAFIAEKLPALKSLDTRIIANIFGYRAEDYIEVARRLNECSGIAALELNISCPNTKKGGIEFASDPEATFGIVKQVKEVSQRLPVIIKLSPNAGDISVFARACEAAGADAISLVNTFLGMAIDVDNFMPRFRNIFAGLSGPAIKPLALRLVYQAARSVKIPVIGIGGISKAEDAIEFLLAGARAVQVGTAHFYDPQATVKIIDGLEAFCRRKGIDNINRIVGALKT